MLYCKNCGTPLTDIDKFCAKCGTAVARDTTPTPTVESKTAAVEENTIADKINQYIRSTTTFADANSFIEGAKPLKWRWPLICVVTFISAIFLQAGAIIVLMGMWLATYLICTIMMIKQNTAKFSLSGHPLPDCRQLSIFLSENMRNYPFTAWQSGIPWLASTDNPCMEIVECCFRNNTYHRILIDKDNPQFYNITVSNATFKEKLKNGGTAHPASTYTANYIVQHMLVPAIEAFYEYQETEAEQ